MFQVGSCWMASAEVPSVAPVLTYSEFGIPGPSQVAPTLLDKLCSKVPTTCAWHGKSAPPRNPVAKTPVSVAIQPTRLHIAIYPQAIGQFTRIRPDPSPLKL